MRRELEVLLLMFADDTKGAKIIKGPEDREKLQEALDCLCEWAEKWGMSFNVAKCKIMHVGRNNPEYDYFMNGVKVCTTEEEKDVGVMVTKNLKPSLQCSKAAGRATAVLNQIRRNFHYRDRFTFLRLYKQYVRPHLEFAVPAWSPWAKGDIETLERVQEKALKMVSGLKGKTYNEKLTELGMSTLESRRHDQDMNLVYKLLSGDSGSEMFTLVGTEERTRTRQTAGTLNLVGQFARTDQRKFSFAVRTVDKWNHLPDDVKQAQSQQAFKSRLKAWKK